MDTDLSLIEIAGEDDSLLQPIPGGAAVLNSVNGGRTSNATDYFLCSPLQIPRSKPKPIEAMAAIKENFSVETANKENFNMEKPEALKLSLEPQQMKRTRKGGGYNLRKSLAWDRAFFTEEGVLDASELSMISGDFSKSNGNPLSAIQEEVGCNSSGVKTRKENLIRKSPATKNVGASFLQKERSKEASTSVANRKVLSTHNVNRSGLKRSACPRTTASSSLKRPASSITTKASEKDSKVCKPVQKPHPAGPSRIGKSSIPSPVDPKRSQITRPGSNSVENTRKLFGFKESSSSSKGAQNNRKAGPDGKLLPTKTSFGQAKRNVVSSVKGSCANVKIPLRTEATNPPCSSSGYGSRSIFDDGGSAKTAIPPSQHTETQTAKPTGLRMPSPSLGFFAQSTAVAQSPVKMISQPCKDPESNISHQRKFGIQTPVSTQKPPLPPRRLPKLQIDGTATESLKASNFCSGASSFINYISGTSEIMESKAQVNSVRLVEEKLKIGENGFEAFNDQIKLQSVNDRVDMTLNMNDKSVSQKPYEKLDKNNTDMKVVDGSLKGTKTSESKDSHESELNRCSEPCLLPGNLLDCEADAAKQVECQNLDDCKLDFIDSHQVSENDGSHDGTTLMESGNMEEDVHSGEDVIAMGQKSELAVLFLNDASAEHADHANNEDKELDPCSEIPRSNYYSHTKVKSCTEAVGQKSELEVLFQNGASAEHADYANNEDKERDPCSEIPSFNYDSQTEVKCSTEAVGQKSELEVLFQNDASAEHADHANNEDKELNPCSEIPSCNYNSQTKVKSCPERGNSLIKQDCVLGGEGNNVKNQEFQDQQMKNSSCENERIACGKNECPAIERLMFEEDTLSLEESKKLENGNTAGVYPEVSSDGSGLENLDSLLREKMDCMVRVSEDCNCVIKKQEESCEFQHSGNKTEEDSAVCVLGAGLGPISQDNQKNNAFEVNDFETVLDQGDDNDTELKISSPPTFQDDDAGQNKETEILEAEDSPTMEIQRSVKKLQFSSPKQEKENNLPEANSSEDMLDTKDEDAKSEQKNDDADKRHEGLVKKLPANLVPFSDEWLVALEAAGEEILMRKSGAVQNSPEERSEPKPGPWSPVKRKYHQALGPFDCTKHTNH